MHLYCISQTQIFLFIFILFLQKINIGNILRFRFNFLLWDIFIVFILKLLFLIKKLYLYLIFPLRFLIFFRRFHFIDKFRSATFNIISCVAIFFWVQHILLHRRLLIVILSLFVWFRRVGFRLYIIFVLLYYKDTLFFIDYVILLTIEGYEPHIIINNFKLDKGKM